MYRLQYHMYSARTSTTKHLNVYISSFSGDGCLHARFYFRFRNKEEKTSQILSRPIEFLGDGD